MKIFINGKEKEVSSNLTALELINNFGYSNQRVALEINSQIIPKSNFANKMICAYDKIEIIKAVGGG